MTTGEVAALAGVSIATLRYYERRGLIAEPARTEAGYRAYPDSTVATVRTIKRAQRLGFTLKEIRRILELKGDPRSRTRDVLVVVDDKLSELDARIETLQQSRQALAGLVQNCTKAPDDRAQECALFQFLEAADSG